MTDLSPTASIERAPTMASRISWALMLAKADLREAQRVAYKANRKEKACRAKVDTLQDRLKRKLRSQ